MIFMFKEESYKGNYVKIRNQESEFATDYTLIRLIVILGTKCSLRCRDCNNLIPLFNHQTDLNIQKIILSLQNILKVADYICRLELIGGEPFLSSNLESVLNFVLKQEKILKVEITTNGTVIPSESLISLLRNEKVKICISDYGDMIDYSMILKFCQKNALNYKVLHIDHWIQSGDVKKRSRSIDDLKYQYLSCQSSYFCKTLFEDKLFQCARASSMYALNICDDSNSYLKIDSDFSNEKLFNFVFADNNPACDHCNTATSYGVLIKPAIQEEVENENKRDA